MSRQHPAQWSDGAAGPLLSLFDEVTDPDTRWQDSALCAQVDGEIFFPPKGGNARDAKNVCRHCDVSRQCLEYALDVESRPEVLGRFGVYGGTSPDDREAIAIQRKAEAA